MTQETLSPPAPPEAGKKRHSSLGLLVWLLVLVLLGLAAYYFGLPWLRSAKSTAAPSETSGAGRKGRGAGVTPVVTDTVRKGNIGVYINGLGAVIPTQTVTIKSRVDGQLMKIYYIEGQVVHEGDPLVEIDPRPYQVQLEQAEGQLIKDQAALANAQLDLVRYEKLLAQKAIPQQQFSTQQTTVTQFEGGIKTDQAQIDSAKLNLTYCHITAPITGRIGLRLVDTGNIVHANDANGLLVITQLQPITVIFTVAEDQLPPVRAKMRAGQHLTVEALSRDLNTRLGRGTLSTLDNQIDQTTGTLKLRATFDNQDDALFPNQFVNARLLVEEKRGVTLLPNPAIQRNSQLTYVYVVKDDQTVTVRPVVLGTTEGDVSEITSGLAPGDIVVTDGVDKLQEGSKVNPRPVGERSGTPGAASPGHGKGGKQRPAGAK